jgi:hypothetical protein
MQPRGHARVAPDRDGSAFFGVDSREAPETQVIRRWLSRRLPVVLAVNGLKRVRDDVIRNRGSL